MSVFILLPLLLLLLLLLHLAPSPSLSAPAPSRDARALLQLKNSFINATALTSWSLGNSSFPTTEPCDPKARWVGVQCLQGIILGIRLPGMGIIGTLNVNALVRLPALRNVNIINNSFYGRMPEFNRIPGIRAILISHNRFSGPISPDFFVGMTHLKKMWIDDNAFNGPIPDSMPEATKLAVLHMENNHFGGRIPRLPPPVLSELNVSNNGLEGPVPKKYSRFNVSSFAGNKALCGDLIIGIPCLRMARTDSQSHRGRNRAGKDDDGNNTSVAIGCIIFLLFMCIGMYSIKAHDLSREIEVVPFGKPRAESEEEALRGPGASRGSEGDAGAGEAGELVIVNERKGRFGLPELMKLEAEVMGNGSIGSAYKLVMTNEVAVAVKRVRKLNRVGKEEFDAEMGRLGRMSHPNVLPLLAYNYRKEEKLLVSEFVDKGSLLYLLHGSRSVDHFALDWPTRLKIASGIASGLTYLHAELPFNEVPHGNLKSSNVLISDNYEPLIVDYGLLPLLNPDAAADAFLAFRSPEALAGQPVSPQSDVYCLGIVILELLSGNFPSQYLSNLNGGTDVVQWATDAVAEVQPEAFLDPAIVADAKAAVPEMTRLMHVGMECAEPERDRRLGLKEAEERIEELVVAEAQRPKPAKGQGQHAREGTIGRSRRQSIGEQSGKRYDDVTAFGV